MATSGSRIPFPGTLKNSNTNTGITPGKLKRPGERFQTPLMGVKKSNERILASSVGPKKPAVKPIPTRTVKRKPDENMFISGSKRPKVDMPPPPPQPNRLQKVRSNMHFMNGGFSEAAKKKVLQPQRSVNCIRESAPPLVENKKPSKRPAWDIKGRMYDMENVNKDLTDKLEHFMERVTRLEEDKTTLEHDVHTKSVVSREAMATIERLEKELSEKKTELQATITEKDFKLRELQSQNENLMCESTVLKSKVSTMEPLITTLSTTQLTIKTELEAMRILYTKTLEEKEKCEALIETLKQRNTDLKKEVREHENVRRKLHNLVQELKGNIRVFCRIRPSLPIENNRLLPMSTIAISPDNKTLEISNTSDSGTSLSLHKAKSAHEFTFDLVFGENTSQDEVFYEISQLVQSALDGYHVCIFAYGQTGSGKTYTMEGPEDLTDFMVSSKDVRLGMIPRAVHQIFSSVEELKSKGWKYSVETSFMEIYNENIRDMLVDNSQNGAPKCEIKRTASKGNDGYISNITTKVVASSEEVSELLKIARMNRAVAATNCNERSSRSHYIFQMKLLGENEVTNERCEGILNLIDLAGSERVKDSGSAGDRFTEAKNINKSLSNLGNVIMALSQKADHVPYRNSKLTHLLMNSLGGQAKTLMFVNVSPCNDHFNETVNSLRFATKVNQCHIGTAQKKYKN